MLTILSHGTPNFRRVNVSVLRVVGGSRRGSRRGSLGTGKRRTVPKIWRAVPIFLARVNGVLVFTRSSVRSHKRNRKVVLGDNVLHI